MNDDIVGPGPFVVTMSSGTDMGATSHAIAIDNPYWPSGAVRVDDQDSQIPVHDGTGTVQPLIASDPRIDRLIALLELTEEERSFVRAALLPSQGRDLWLVLADYLEERVKDEASARFRRMGR